MKQLAIEFGCQLPLVCEHRHWVPAIDRVWCDKGAGVWTMCGTLLCGEIVGCAYDEPDNSPEACARRVEWLRDHKAQGGNVDA